MTPFAALVLYPIWSVALATGLVALRLGRSTRRGLVVLCTLLAAWITGLVLLESGSAAAERVLPFGMLLGGAFLHAATDVARAPRPRLLALGYGWGALVALLGLVAPSLLYAPGARAAGPLFWPIAAASTVGTVLTVGYLARLARAPDDRGRRVAIAVACAMGALGGGGVIGLRVLGLADVPVAAPFLLVATLLAAFATFAGEDGRARDLVIQGASQALVTAVLSMIGLTAFYLLLPSLLPNQSLAWTALVVFLAALPLEPLRLLVVERIHRALFRRATTVPDLAASVEASEARADQAERLAELGRVVAAVAHEIRNPLGVIVAQTKLLERRGADEKILADLRAQVDRARRFLDDLLRYGKPRPLEPKTFEARPAIELAISTAKHDTEAEVRVEVPDGARVVADRAAFSDVVTILVQNACIAAPHVTVRAERGDDFVLVVEDDGPGVPKELEATLFDPFVTGRGRDAKHPGTGLGLAIARRWLERHEGSLTYARVSEAGGARFIVRWPRVR